MYHGISHKTICTCCGGGVLVVVFWFGMVVVVWWWWWSGGRRTYVYCEHIQYTYRLLVEYTTDRGVAVLLVVAVAIWSWWWLRCRGGGVVVVLVFVPDLRVNYNTRIHYFRIRPDCPSTIACHKKHHHTSTTTTTTTTLPPPHHHHKCVWCQFHFREPTRHARRKQCKLPTPPQRNPYPRKNDFTLIADG